MIFTTAALILNSFRKQNCFINLVHMQNGEVVFFFFLVQIREEDKDPVYLYFESMMTCARVRVYEPGKEEKKQQKDQKDSQSSFVKVRSYAVSSMYHTTGRNIENGKKIFPQDLLHNMGAWLLFDGRVVTDPKSAGSDGKLTLLLVRGNSWLQNALLHES